MKFQLYFFNRKSRETTYFSITNPFSDCHTEPFWCKDNQKLIIFALFWHISKVEDAFSCILLQSSHRHRFAFELFQFYKAARLRIFACLTAFLIFAGQRRKQIQNQQKSYGFICANIARVFGKRRKFVPE
ncbi:MAG TPA: hypothetical protein IAD18_07195 [Candidatus Limisoma intestinavium]|uniref:Uncharacterized protein n=1 Tax=Candidatus Limisoma intestinavium TaxID=2840856 RepID=A0A9D1LG56_9BACT|nr:hypothetical protein [Candidatus Limisoma intestinavium]